MAHFISVFNYIGSEAQKLAEQNMVIENPNSVGVFATLQALIDLQKDGFPPNSPLLDTIKEMVEKLEYLEKVLKPKTDL